MKPKQLIFLSLLPGFLFLFSCKNMKQPAYKNPKLSVEERVNDLISRMTPEEKISQMVHEAKAIPRLDVPEYNWWNECLHGVARAGIATVFPQAIGLGATWDTTLILEMATIISDEARAKHHEALRNGDHGIYKGLTMWSPNINIFRDPRWGRGQETYGEDPYLTGRIGVSFVKGLQGDDPKYLKLVSTPKHYAVHSGPEPERHEFDAIAHTRDLWETYLPAFEATVTEANAWSVMGAYNRYNGQACCAHELLLEDILRDQWQFPGYVVSDCGAINDIWADHKIVETPAEASALAVKRGCDLNCGDTYPMLIEALEKGLITEEEIDVSLQRLFTARFRLGMFDPPEMVEYAQIPIEVNDSEEHRAFSRVVAQKSMVLLKNENNFLPLKKDLKAIAVLGPNADNLDILLGNYNGTPSQPVTPLDGIRNKLGENVTIYHAFGCGLTGRHMAPIPASAFVQPGDAEEPGLKMEFFKNLDVLGEPVYSRIDPNVNFVWDGARVYDDAPPDTFSIRWTGKIVAPVTGNYTLGVEGDDGYRLYINDEMVIENWEQHGPESEQIDIQLQANKAYHIKLEYFEKTGGAMVNMFWAVPGADATDEAIAYAKKSDVVIMFGGISPKLEGEEMGVNAEGFEGGDRTDIALPKVQVDLLKKIYAVNKNVVLVLMNGSALAVNWADANIPAILEAWYPGQEGGNAIADVLFGDYNPAGRLPVTFYKSVNDLPPFRDYNMENRTYKYFRGDPLYAFGHGLSYTSFDYADLAISGESMAKDGKVTISCNITNSGDVAGEEVVQLYITDVEASTPRPIRELKDFQRLSLKAGETKKVEFTLPASKLWIINDKEERVVEPGEFIVQVGASSEDIRLKGTFEVE